MKRKFLFTTAVLMLAALVFTGIHVVNSSTGTTTTYTAVSIPFSTASADTYTTTASSTVISTSADVVFDVADMFTERDLEQTADLSEAVYITLTSEQSIQIAEEGVYVLSGTASNVTVEVDAGDDAKVQLVLDGVSVTNSDMAFINVLTADKVFVTLTDSTNYAAVTGAYSSDNIDAVIFSKSDLTLNGTGSLTIVSSKANGITSKDDLKITGGTYDITAALDSLEANDSIRIYDGYLDITAGKDALHCENSEDTSLGYVYVCNGKLQISAGDDGIQGNAIVQIDGGTINITKSVEGIESTYVQINGGVIDIYATDDGINAARKSAYNVILEINGGDIDVSMGSGDTDALDANGNLYITGGTLNITANSAFDYDNAGSLSGGTVYVNGSLVTTLTQSMMGGRGSMTQQNTMPSQGGGKPGR